MEKLIDLLLEDYRLKEGLNACINCGTCTAICPAAEFYRYNPKNIVNIVQGKDEDQIRELLTGDEIWYCGECMSCVTRCPRKNAPGLIIMALRYLSLKTGLFIESEKGRQQYAVSKSMVNNILDYGYCVYPRGFTMDLHPEYGYVGEWICDNLDDIHQRLGSSLDRDGPGVLRKIPQESLDELKSIFEVTGAMTLYNTVVDKSMERAKELGLSEQEYFDSVFHNTSDNHFNN